MTYGGKAVWKVDSNVYGYLGKLHSIAFPVLFGAPQSGGFFIIIIQKHNWIFLKGKFISGLSVYHIYGYFVISKNLEVDMLTQSLSDLSEAVNFLFLSVANTAELYSTPTGLY